MATRPNVQSRRERQVERDSARRRARRDAALPRPERRAAPPEPEPYITCVGRGKPARPIPPAVQEWIDAEARAQLKRYRAIVREVDALAPLREQWAREFYERITGPRGFSVHAGMRRTIGREELPQRPARPWRVVW